MFSYGYFPICFRSARKPGDNDPVGAPAPDRVTTAARGAPSVAVPPDGDAVQAMRAI